MTSCVREVRKMPPTLPQELIDQTIDHLWNDVDALAACALACHAFLPSARTHLFRDQRIIGAKGCARFEALLDASPELAPYVRKLSLTEPTSTAHAQPWVARLPALAARLGRLATLELVGLHHAALPRCGLGAVPGALAAFARLEHLVFADVYFDRWHDIHALLAAACNAQSVCFYRVGWANRVPGSEPADAAIEVRAPAPLALKRLVVDSWAASVMLREWLLPCAAVGEVHLRSLMVRWRERDSIDVLNALFRACGKALQSLYVELPTTIDGMCLSAL